jgi:hypothetical protein
VSPVAGRAALPLSNFDSITLNHHTTVNDPNDQPGLLAPSISTTQSANSTRTYYGNIASGRARAQYGDAHYHGGTHLHLHCELYVSEPLLEAIVDKRSSTK